MKHEKRTVMEAWSWVAMVGILLYWAWAVPADAALIWPVKQVAYERDASLCGFLGGKVIHHQSKLVVLLREAKRWLSEKPMLSVIYSEEARNRRTKRDRALRIYTAQRCGTTMLFSKPEKSHLQHRHSCVQAGCIFGGGQK